MFRAFASLSLIALLLYSCVKDNPRPCSGQDPEFIVVLKLMGRPLPIDTVVHVTYAGAAEEKFRLSDPKALKDVTFCKLADQDGVPLEPSAPQAMGAAAAAGAADSDNPSQGVAALYCELYTGGSTQLKVSGTGFDTQDYDLAPSADLCTVIPPPFVLDSADAG